MEECSGVSEQRSVLLVSESHGQQVLGVLQGFRERGALFDFSVRVQEETLPCHRCVLAACSDFFRAMFELDMRERGAGSVTLGDLSPQAVRVFLDFAYSGEIEIREDNVDMLFQLASFLQVDFLSRACSDFLLQTLDLSNCLQLLALAEAYGSPRLLHRATDFATQNFHALSSAPDFPELTPLVLERCLSSDALDVPDEDSVLHALLRWTRHDGSRRTLLPKLLPRVRLHHLRASALEEAERRLSADGCSVSVIQQALADVYSFGGLFCDARPSTTSSYIFVHKSEDSGEVRHAFCYNIGADLWRELPNDAAQIVDRPGSSLTSFGEKLFVMGGCLGGCHRAVRLHIEARHHDATDEVWCYSPVARSYTPAQRMRNPRTMHAAVVARNRIYVIGGKTLEVEYLDPLSDAWTSVSPLPKAIFFPEASACGSVVYTLGSELEITEAFNPSLDCFLRYDAVEDQWSQLVAEFGQFFHATLVKSVSVKDSLYLCDLSTYKVYRFCAESCDWKGEGSFECAGFNASAVAAREKIYILGGDYSPDEVTDEVQVYDSARSEWQEVSPMPRALTEFHCQVISFSRYRDPWTPSDTHPESCDL